MPKRRLQTILPLAVAALAVALPALVGPGCRAQTPADLGSTGAIETDGAGSSAGEATGESGEQTGQPGTENGSQGAEDYDPKKGLSTEKAVIVTNRGAVVFAFYPKEADQTVANFKKLAAKRFYDGTKWHRVEPGFVIQGGDPLSKDADPANDGQGGPGYTIPAEFNEHRHVAGAVAMARSSDPNSAGSQFYITLAPQPTLDGQYTVFGLVINGMDVVKKTRKGDVIKRVYVKK